MDHDEQYESYMSPLAVRTQARRLVDSLSAEAQLLSQLLDREPRL